MTFDTWQAFYTSDLQSLWGLLPISLATLAAVAFGAAPRERGAAPAQRALLLRWVALFAAVSIGDALATTLGVRALGWADTDAGLALVVAFVLIGDFRIFLLLFAFADPEVRRLRDVAPRAAAWTLVVPVATLAVAGAIRLLAGSIATMTLWLLYEIGFVGMALFLRERLVPRAVAPAPPGRRPWLRAVLGFVALYYALWAASDVMTSWLGLDLGWALRALPNQLYYGLLVPFVWLSFFARRYAATSAPVQASR